MTGFLITFEGPDGAGKTTQLSLLAEHLRQRGFGVQCTREPGGTALGDKIRSLLLDPANQEMGARTEALLYMAARAQHVSEFILPALNRGEVVLSDRYSDSTIVYQGVARQLERAELDVINQFAISGIAPQLTILLDGEADVLRDRLADREVQDRIEQECSAFHQKVRQGFHELAAAEPDRIKVVAAGGDIDAVQKIVVGLVEEFLGRRGDNEG